MENFLEKIIKKKRTSENLVYDLMTFLAKSKLQTMSTNKDVALPKIVRESLVDEKFHDALYTIAGKMLDLFESKF